MRGWDNWRRNVEQRTRESRQRQQQDLYNEVDRILAKIQRDGIASLTGKEKRTLETATKLQRGEGRFDDR